MRELQIKTDNLKEKTGTLNVLHNKHTTKQIQFIKQRLGRVISDAERKA